MFYVVDVLCRLQNVDVGRRNYRCDVVHRAVAGRGNAQVPIVCLTTVHSAIVR